MWESIIVVLGTVISGILLLFLIKTFKNTKRMQEVIQEEEAGLEELSSNSERSVYQVSEDKIY